GAVNVMPFLVRFHYTLAAGPWGRFVLGLAALIWVPVCLAGLVLSLPRGRKGTLPERLRTWGPAWKIRRKQGSRIFAYDLHRASGLWVWPMMLVFAWSAVAFNLDSVHQPVQRFFGAQGLYTPPQNPSPAQGEKLNPQAAVEIGSRLMAREAARQGFTIRGPEAISFNSFAHAIGYYARTSLDGPTDRGSTVVWFDEVSGRQLGFRSPFGSTGADALDKAVRLLHTGDVFGWPYRIFVSLFGLLTAASSIAGVVMWIRRR
ncbi:MAG TPA: PepSY-associated TM helix domain-containing protein, partial [Sphingomonadaceae bacterium]|nr:PepSY-associated TM helix domain-containing protein [Sphingomonadaceae bacterium]